ncbi:VC0807 family protein [Clostridium sp.]|uniref:VC0807 family protein n=1 Tax=Clostridium sp. TaxID=1506 RepID=UPI00261D4A1F|nr:VC0807 family protein [Clostridium sp.]
MEKVSNSSNKKYPVLKNIFNKDFIVSAIIPVLMFSVLDKYGMTLNGIILSGAWSIGVVLIDYIKQHKVNALATMSAVFSGVGIIGSVISKNPSFYFVAPIIQDLLIALIFFGSLFCEKTLIEIIVEQSYLKNVSEEVKKQPKYKSVWRIITIAWTILNIAQAALRVVLLKNVSMSSYYALSTFYSNISTTMLIAFSIMFPKWYWKNKK